MSYSTEVLSDGPVHYWPLEVDATDSAGTADGTVVGASFSADVPAGSTLAGSLLFDGVDDYVSTGPSSPSATTLSVEAWVRRGTATDGTYRALSAGAFPDGWACGVKDASGSEDGPIFTVFGVLDYDTSTNRLDQARNSMPPDTWQHFVMTYAPNDVVQVYIDGTFIDARFTTDAPTSMQDFVIGATSGLSEHWNGNLAHVAYYDKVLTAARIQAHYDAAFAAEYTYLPPALMVTLQDPTTKSLSWTDQSADKYIIERNSSPDGSVWTFDKFVEEAGLTLLDTIVDDGTQYRYRIKSVKAV